MRLLSSIVVFMSVFLLGCRLTFNMSGSNMNYDMVRTIEIPMFNDESGKGPANASQIFTERLRDYFQNNTKLQIVNEKGDLKLEGAIVQYEIVITGASGTEQLEAATRNRLSFVVSAELSDFTEQPEKNEFKSKSFKNTNAEFDANADFSALEQGLIEEAADQVIQEIFASSFNNW